MSAGHRRATRRALPVYPVRGADFHHQPALFCQPFQALADFQADPFAFPEIPPVDFHSP